MTEAEINACYWQANVVGQPYLAAALPKPPPLHQQHASVISVQEERETASRRIKQTSLQRACRFYPFFKILICLCFAR